MVRSFWLVNTNRSRVKRFIENTNNEDQFYKYMFIESGKVTFALGMNHLQWYLEKNLERGRERTIEKLIAQGWRRAEEDWTKKEE